MVLPSTNLAPLSLYACTWTLPSILCLIVWYAWILFTGPCSSILNFCKECFHSRMVTARCFYVLKSLKAILHIMIMVNIYSVFQKKCTKFNTVKSQKHVGFIKMFLHYLIPLSGKV